MSANYPNVGSASGHTFHNTDCVVLSFDLDIVDKIIRFTICLNRVSECRESGSLVIAYVH